MSKRCNYCTLIGLTKVAEQAGHILTVLPHPILCFPDGVNVYIHPADAPIPPLGWWAAWFTKLPGECACGRLSEEPIEIVAAGSSVAMDSLGEVHDG